MTYDYNEIVFPKLGIDLHVNSTAFSIGGLNIQWYGILITLGIILAVIFALKNSKRVGLDVNRLIDVIIFGLIGAIIGARAYYVIMSWDEYKDNVASIFNIRQGGLAFYGGLIGALIAGLITAKIRKVKVLPLLDLAGIGFFIGQAIGRWGNFFNQEAFGTNTNGLFGMSGGKIQKYIENSNISNYSADIPVHPCFLYESTWCVLGLILTLILFYKFRKFDGEIFLVYLGWYGLGRSFIEGLRTDSLYIGTIRVSQALAILCVIFSVIMLIVMVNYVRRQNGDYLLYKDTPDSKYLLEHSQGGAFVEKSEDFEKNNMEESQSEGNKEDTEKNINETSNDES